MRILLTGSTGFLGSALARYWHEREHDLLLMVRPLSDTRRIKPLLPAMRLVRINGTMDVQGLVEEFVPEAIVHTACCYGRGGESLVDILDVNLRLGIALLQAMLRPVARRTVFLNTGTVLQPDVSLYALSKAQFSQWGGALSRQRPDVLQFIDVRLQQVYGPGDARSKFITYVLEACRNNEPHLALTAGEQRRDLIHVDDVVRAYDLILEKRASFSASDSIDVGSGTAVRIRDFAELAKHITQSSTVLDFGAVPYRQNEAMYCVANTARLSALGWQPIFDLEAGMRHTLSSGYSA